MPDSFFSLDLSLLHWLNSSNSLYFDSLVPSLTSGLTWIPLYIALLYLVVKNNETMAQIGMVVGAAVVCIILAIRDRLFSVSMVLWALLNSWTRLYLGVHYPSDVLCGLLYGCIVGGIVYLAFYKLFYKFNIKFQYISSQYTASGYAKADIDVVVSTMVLTLAVVILGAFFSLSI